MTDGIMQVEENRDEINEAVPSDGEYEQEPSSVRHEGSEDEGEDLMDNMEAYVCLIDVVEIVCTGLSRGAIWSLNLVDLGSCTSK